MRKSSIRVHAMRACMAVMEVWRTAENRVIDRISRLIRRSAGLERGNSLKAALDWLSPRARARKRSFDVFLFFFKGKGERCFGGGFQLT